jgi:hypothetical protein
MSSDKIDRNIDLTNNGAFLNDKNNSKYSFNDYVDYGETKKIISSHTEKLGSRSSKMFVNRIQDYCHHIDDNGTLVYQDNWTDNIYCFRCGIILTKDEDNLCFDCEKEMEDDR